MTKTEKQWPAKWIQAIRVFSLTASIIPVLVGAALAFAHPVEADWRLFPLIFVAGVLYHAATNLINDYYDFRNHVDTIHSRGGSRVIVDNILTPRQVLIAGLLMFAVGTALGFILVAIRGLPMLIIGIVGFLGGLFYTAKPIGYKYLALGDFGVFILMGPMMAIGAFYALTGTYDNSVLLVSLPVGFLVAAILSANNLRDIEHDTGARVRTVESVIGPQRARLWYYLLVICAYAAVILMVAAGILSPWSLLVFLTAPLTIRNFTRVRRSGPEHAETIAAMDVLTAQLHLAFGLLLILSIFIAALV